MATVRRNRGFTLIELLVVVSIVVLLISILLPAVGGVRQQARISVCEQNMKQHAIGAEVYAGQNDGNLPHGPKAPPAPTGVLPEDAPYGFPNRVARYYGTREFEVAGFRFDSDPEDAVNPIRGMGNVEIPISVTAQGAFQTWEFLQMTTGYWTVLSTYMTEEEGVAALFSGPFISPSHPQARETVEFFNEEIQDANGRMPDLQDIGPELDLLSYRYVSSALMDPKLYTWSNGSPIVTGVDLANYAFDDSNFYQWVRDIPTSSVTFPSSKVLFFMWNAWHNNDLVSWVQPSAVIPVALADGSARRTIPYEDGILEDPGSNFGDNRDNAGPFYSYNIDFGQGFSAYPAHYFATYGGIRGRDL